MGSVWGAGMKAGLDISGSVESLSEQNEEELVCLLLVLGWEGQKGDRQTVDHGE